MKKLVGLIIIILILLLAGYYGTGLMTEKTLKRDITVINQSNGLQANIINYDRGWFTSKAKLDLKVSFPERVQKDDAGNMQVVPAQEYTVDIPLNIYHGPVMFAPDGMHFGLGYAKTSLDLPKELKGQIENTFKESSSYPKLNLSVLISYLNTSSFRANLPEFQLVAKNDGGQFNWKGLNTSVTVSSNMDTISGQMDFTGFEVNNKNTDAKLNDLSSEYDIYKGDSGLYLGTGSVTLPSFEISKANQKIFQLSDFTIHSNSGVDDGLFHSTLTISLDKVIAEGKTYGPGEFKIAIKNLHAQTLAKMNEQMQQIQGASDQIKQQAVLSLLPDLPKLLSKGAELNISELNFTMPQGRLEGNLSVSLPEGDGSNPFQMIQQVKGEAMLELPQIILKEALKETAKQQLIQKPTLTDALAQQMQQQADPQNQPSNDGSNTSSKPVIGNEEAAQSMDDTQSTVNESGDSSTQETADSNPVNKQMTLAELDQKAESKANEKIQSLITAGTIKRDGDKFVVHVKLNGGQLTVNGQPFNSSMIQY